MPRALLSVYDKTGIAEFARALTTMGWEILASGGTATVLKDADITVIDVADLTGFPAILGHRVVTLHPAVHGAILADLDDPAHHADLETHGITPIDLVVVGLYPFALDPSVELIDVGGPAMIRAAAKNHHHVGVVTSRDQYETVLTEIAEHGALLNDTRRDLAHQAFAMTSAYDAAIVSWLAGDALLPTQVTLSLRKTAELRYGENPHQVAARYTVAGSGDWWSTVEQLGGKALSYLNVLDAESAYNLAWRFDAPAAVIVKHANPCGVAIGLTVEEAYGQALACDPKSAFGGIVALNDTVDAPLARTIIDTFTEVVIAPRFTEAALGELTNKPNLRVLQGDRPSSDGRQYRQIHGGFLLQSPDPVAADTATWKVVSDVEPTDQQMRDAELAWITCAAVWSNAIVIARNGATVGIGGGQQSRVDAVELACRRAGQRGASAVAASDAFFPFPDGPQQLYASGIGLIVQPGGSNRDEESVAAANAAGRAMVFTGQRHFRH